MRSAFVAALVAALGVAACTGPQEEEAAPDPALMPGGYLVTVDGNRTDPGQFVTAEEPQGIRVTTGPGGIAWHPEDTVSAGDFRVEATLTVHGAPLGYREGYGIFVGGRDLRTARPSYLYLLVRPTGEFLVRRRTGEEVETPVEWLSHNAVQRVAVDGDEPVNTLAIEVRGEETRLLVNGVVVFILPTEEAAPYGRAGLRVNHRLDISVEHWTLGPPPPLEEPTSTP